VPMSTTAVRQQFSPGITDRPASPFALAAAVLGFFMITFDAVVVNIALPSIQGDFGGGISDLQWVAAGYTLMFAALLLTAGALSDRVGARRAFTAGLKVFVVASAACGLAPNLTALVAARFVQGAAAAVMMPASMALIHQAYPDPSLRRRAVAIWAVGASVASSSGPVLGGVLCLFTWRMIFFINVPVGVVVALLLARTAHSGHRKVPFDWVGQTMAVLSMGALTYGAIEVGAVGATAPQVVAAFTIAVVALAAFLVAQARRAHPMMPLGLFRSRDISVTVAVGFAFMVGYYGLPFVMSLYLQEQRGLPALAAGFTFLPMMLVGAFLTPFSARIVETRGARLLIGTGLLLMTLGLTILGIVPSSTPTWALAALMVLVGLGGPLVMPPVTAVLLNAVPVGQAGTASGVFNTSRQVGGALAVAVFGALLAQPATFMHGLRISMFIAAGVTLTAAAASQLLKSKASQRI
jgi:MFS transporter, DHA2 family, methylenomycin A resistance protein